MDIFSIICMVLFYGVCTPIIMFVSFGLGQKAGKYYKPIWKAFAIFIIGAGLMIGFFYSNLDVNIYSLIMGLVWTIPGIVGIFLIMKGKDYISKKEEKK